MLFANSNCSNAQDEPWEFSPYRVRTMVLTDDVPELNGVFFDRMANEVNQLAESTDKSGWRVNLQQAPAFYRPMMAMGIEKIELGSVTKTVNRENKRGEIKPEKVNFLTIGGLELSDGSTELDDIKNGDRIAFVRIQKTLNGYAITTRQLDCQLHLWGPVATKETRYLSCVPVLVYQSVVETLVPVAKIERIEGKFVRLRIRAALILNRVENGTVVPNLDSPARVDLSTVYRPVVRKNDKNGDILVKDGIKEYEWTLLQPVEIVNTHGNQSYTKAGVHGAVNSPLAGRANKSQKKFAVAVRATKKRTKLSLITRDKFPKPVPDKKIYLKYPWQKKDDEAIVIGRTDRKGAVYLDRNEHPLHLIYIKSGEKRVLAKLPIVPGYHEELVAAMQDDRIRLRAEGILAGYEFSFMDLTVRREVYAMRIRSNLEKGKPKIARELYNQFSTLKSPDDFSKDLNKDKEILISEAIEKAEVFNGKRKKKQEELIGKMFSGLQVLVQQRMLATLSSDLDKDILTVEKGGTYKPKSNVDALEKELSSTE